MKINYKEGTRSPLNKIKRWKRSKYKAKKRAEKQNQNQNQG